MVRTAFYIKIVSIETQAHVGDSVTATIFLQAIPLVAAAKNPPPVRRYAFSQRINGNGQMFNRVLIISCAESANVDGVYLDAKIGNGA